MATTYKKIPNVHRLVEAARHEDVRDLLTRAENATFSSTFDGVTWPAPGANGADASALRSTLLARCQQADKDIIVQLERFVSRLIPLVDGGGIEIVARVVRDLPDQSKRKHLEDNCDQYGRVIWLYLNDVDHFDEIVWRFHHDQNRNHGKMHAAFEVDAALPGGLTWDDSTQQALTAQIQKVLKLTSAPTIIHHEITDERMVDGVKSTVVRHMLIVRHSGPLSSVLTHEKGRGKSLYFHPLNEAGLIYSPDEKLVEVVAAGMGIKQALAESFASSTLNQDLSKKPLLQKQYNLSQFLVSFDLPQPVAVNGISVESVKLVEVHAKARHAGRLMSFKVGENDPMEVAAREEYGENHVFRRASCISKATILVNYAVPDSHQTRKLPITVTEPNQCNLRGNKDPALRDLGYALLEQWGILTKVRPLDLKEERAVYPMLLDLFGSRRRDVSGHYLAQRGFDPASLVAGGFMIRKGRYADLPIELDDGTSRQVQVKAGANPSEVVYECPVTHIPVSIAADRADRYELNSDWVQEKVMKALVDALKPAGSLKRDNELMHLGTVTLGTESVPCYLAIGLDDPKVFQRVDNKVRSLNAGTGIVMSPASSALGDFVGPHVVIPAASFLVTGTDDIRYDLEQIENEFRTKRLLAASAQKPTLIMGPKGHSCQLILPGNGTPFVVSGDKQIRIVQAMVKVHPNHTHIKTVMDGTGYTSFQNAFPGKPWSDYFEKAGAKGFWKLKC